MLYLDYSRPGEWVPNRLGGRENLEAIDFLQEMNRTVLTAHPGVLTIAEESTAWGGVSRPRSRAASASPTSGTWGGCTTLEYFTKDPLYRSYEHDKLTFGFIYVWHENFISPLSHDEVVHGKARCCRRCRAMTGSASPTCGPCTRGCGHIRASSCCSWAQARPVPGVERVAASTGTCSSTRRTWASSSCSRSSTRSRPATRRCTRRTSARRASAG
ncbi:MAG: hypothetical protein R2749_32375 [Acidimicrobiales bacterium]